MEGFDFEDDDLLVSLGEEHLVQKPAEVACQLVIARVSRLVLLPERGEGANYLSVMNVREIELRERGFDFPSHLLHHRSQNRKIAILTQNDIDKNMVLGRAQCTNYRIHGAFQIVGTIVSYNH